MIQYRTLISTIDSSLPSGACIVALDGDQLVGSLGLRLREPGGYINSLFVAPTHQKKGIGSRLIEEAARVCEQHRQPTLGLSVHDENHTAWLLYKKLGFQPYDRPHDHYTQCVAVLPLNTQRRIGFGSQP